MCLGLKIHQFSVVINENKINYFLCFPLSLFDLLRDLDLDAEEFRFLEEDSEELFLLFVFFLNLNIFEKKFKK